MNNQSLRLNSYADSAGQRREFNRPTAPATPTDAEDVTGAVVKGAVKSALMWGGIAIVGAVANTNPVTAAIFWAALGTAAVATTSVNAYDRSVNQGQLEGQAVLGAVLDMVGIGGIARAYDYDAGTWQKLNLTAEQRAEAAGSAMVDVLGLGGLARAAYRGVLGLTGPKTANAPNSLSVSVRVRSANLSRAVDHGSEIASFRQRAGLPAFDAADGATGTVARAVTQDGRFYHGVNSGFSPASVPSRMEVVAQLQAKGYFKNVRNIGQAPMMAHAEAHALMRAVDRTGAKAITLYVDRTVCGACRRQLGLLADHLGVQDLKIFELGNPTAIPIRTMP